MRRAWLALVLAPLTTTAGAQAVLTSAGPDDVGVGVYRAPTRSAADAIDPDDLAGFALVTERRTVRLPAGPAVIRFEGVAGNILPESAIVAGLPRGVREKNLDADLLSPRTLYDRSLGRRVLVRRTDRATGRVVERQGTIRSSADGAVLVRVADGVEALRCSGLAETLVYPGVPAGLSAKPTLSIRTDSPRAVTAVLTLSYLAGGFDWQADYVVTMRGDGRGADLFAWITLASSDVTSFAHARAAVIAGRLNRVERERADPDVPDGALRLRCYPTGADYATPSPPPPPPPPAPPAPMMESAMAVADIVVTGTRIAKLEELGDLKLYRLPDRVTVASQAQKQVAFLARDAVPMRAVYVSDVYDDDANDPYLVLRGVNRSVAGLGVPLPAGQVQVFQAGGERPMLIGATFAEDKAVGEDIEYRLEAGPGVSVEVADADGLKDGNGRDDGHVLTVTNANPWPIEFEARLRAGDDYRLRFAQRLIERDGRRIWATTVPANGTATLDYGLEEPPPTPRG